MKNWKNIFWPVIIATLVIALLIFINIWILIMKYVLYAFVIGVLVYLYLKIRNKWRKN